MHVYWRRQWRGTGTSDPVIDAIHHAIDKLERTRDNRRAYLDPAAPETGAAPEEPVAPEQPTEATSVVQPVKQPSLIKDSQIAALVASFPLQNESNRIELEAVVSRMESHGRGKSKKMNVKLTAEQRAAQAESNARKKRLSQAEAGVGACFGQVFQLLGARTTATADAEAQRMLERMRARTKSLQPACQLEDQVPLVIDIETGDPDDLLTLIAVACHPKIELRAVTVTPGSHEQLAMVKWVLQQLNVEPVALGNP